MRDVKIGRIYRHFKGNHYYIKDVAIHSETGEEYVVYQALYDDLKVYIRPKTMFLEKADLNRADNIFKQGYRFELIDMEENKI
ncbi:MAG: DUF1653 domain-containing protein [Lachnospiraceae bacterium]|jgi:hypothetical protein|nr:DUF1653 domain-containing protein [Lachnospiraceae bacterium]